MDGEETVSSEEFDLACISKSNPYSLVFPVYDVVGYNKEKVGIQIKTTKCNLFADNILFSDLFK
ncbi:hypothetical protein QCA50_017252 [Cerrena zonata]|uniref:Uncharacterized protein n=1 Tax=Cerrena zonata TaxID=2478898 RepID=A0AAW0FSR8_9APHY